MNDNIKILLAYFFLVSVTGIIITAYDKIAAKKAPRRRIPERTLILIGIMGGALAMYITMRIIRHKTRKKKFCIGFPVIIAVQAVAAAAVIIIGGVW